ncbi:hypothetical protein SKAU_G00159280 [Synaphobranchus kaupii]|uniref:Uncharacterized protein n=1 Tax=Synaphobranchus kaupii TaxID=118154 RepID=A0A9Q1IZ86_SYNKA|nr:hypothetical protein SKAU_G00159280 [Synaphobranchus kaupii]
MQSFQYNVLSSAVVEVYLELSQRTGNEDQSSTSEKKGGKVSGVEGGSGETRTRRPAGNVVPGILEVCAQLAGKKTQRDWSGGGSVAAIAGADARFIFNLGCREALPHPNGFVSFLSICVYQCCVWGVSLWILSPWQ